jgi:hypothetical protein
MAGEFQLFSTKEKIKLVSGVEQSCCIRSFKKQAVCFQEDNYDAKIPRISMAVSFGSLDWMLG